MNLKAAKNERIQNIYLGVQHSALGENSALLKGQTFLPIEELIIYTSMQTSMFCITSFLANSVIGSSLIAEAWSSQLTIHKITFLPKAELAHLNAAWISSGSGWTETSL